ncbi:MAG: RNA polymerase sigma factor, partial [Anaerolineales bacterium]
WRTGDQRAAESIYNLHKESTYRLAYALLGNSQDAEEAAQDALSYALLHIDRFDQSRSKFTTWLHMITVSRSRDLYRKRRPPTLSLNAWLQQRRSSANTYNSPEHKVETSELRNEVWNAVQTLSPILREAIVLRYWNRHTYQEIGEILGCPMKTAQSRVRLAHQKLAETLNEVEILKNAEDLA